MNVALINMPFSSAERPSLALGLLKSILENEGHNVDIFDFNVLFAKLISSERYEFMCGTLEIDGFVVPNDLLLGEWVFSSEYYELSKSDFSYIDNFLLESGWPMPKHLLDAVIDIRGVVNHFISLCLKSAPWFKYGVVGFTNTFEQTFPSLYLSREIKNNFPSISICFGGANCESEMGSQLLKSFNHIDYVSTCEADSSFPELLRRKIHNCEEETNGFSIRKNGKIFINSPYDLTENLDSLPYPDFDDYFNYVKNLNYSLSGRKGIFIESSRGCWWGQKSHCTFCGLNGRTMSYRRKSPNRALYELLALSKKYDVKKIDFTDNIIDHQYFKTFIKELSHIPHDIQIFFETKSNIKRSDVKKLKEAGVISIQPGIESFSDDTLKLIGKGVSGAQNIALLKWAKQYGVGIAWNLLFGFPNENESSYQFQTDVVWNIHHLEPPQATAAVRLDRFSPNFTSPDQHGFLNIRPMKTYKEVYRLTEEEINNIAYYFEFDYSEGFNLNRKSKSLVSACQQWKHYSHKRPRLEFLTYKDSTSIVVDERIISKKRYHYFSDEESIILALLDKPISLSSLAKELNKRNIQQFHLNRFLKQLKESNLVIEAGSKWIGLLIIGDAILSKIFSNFPTIQMEVCNEQERRKIECDNICIDG
ncbi:MAG: RiPP maturation radical SAM C-methyltransferase [Candidatus Electrothrix sp. YB6]